MVTAAGMMPGHAQPDTGVLTARLAALMFMRFFVWGAWQVTLSLVMPTAASGR